MLFRDIFLPAREEVEAMDLRTAVGHLDTVSDRLATHNEFAANFQARWEQAVGSWRALKARITTLNRKDCRDVLEGEAIPIPRPPLVDDTTSGPTGTRTEYDRMAATLRRQQGELLRLNLEHDQLARAASARALDRSRLVRDRPARRDWTRERCTEGVRRMLRHFLTSYGPPESVGSRVSSRASTGVGSLSAPRQEVTRAMPPPQTETGSTRTIGDLTAIWRSPKKE